MFYYISKKDFNELLENLLAKDLSAKVHGRCKLMLSIINSWDKINEFIIQVDKNNNNIEINIRLSKEEIKETIHNWPGYDIGTLIYDL